MWGWSYQYTHLCLRKNEYDVFKKEEIRCFQSKGDELSFSWNVPGAGTIVVITQPVTDPCGGTVRWLANGGEHLFV